MTLREALISAAQPTGGDPYRLHLCCGFEPLHLVTFLKAHLSKRLKRPVDVQRGLFGDLAGNIERALATPTSTPLAVIVEWSDLDPRLSIREAYTPDRNTTASIIDDATQRLARLRDLLTGRRVVLATPVVPLPPWFPSLPKQASVFTLRLKALLADFAARCAAFGVRVAENPPSAAYDPRQHLHSGFPYTNAYTDELADAMATLLAPSLTAKGLITDLDETLWSGVVGDAGPANVHWDLDRHSRIHGIYQQFLTGLAAQGVLIAAASKNNPAPVAEALRRSDFLIPPSVLFPVETTWHAKSASIQRIAKVWNIGLDSIVFIDNNPLELAEVQQSLPGVECHLFPASAAAAMSLMETLRTRFGRESTTAEDGLRASSIRANAEFAAADPEKLLSGLQAQIAIRFERSPFDPRALELLNKTNQFNLNGLRWEETEFRQFLAHPNSLLAIVSYEDRFGQLGKIAVATAELDGSRLRVKSWVMSCRAFSRRIEFSTLQALFALPGVETIELEWQSTARNSPIRDTLATLFSNLPESGLLSLPREAFAARCPQLFAAVS